MITNQNVLHIITDVDWFFLPVHFPLVVFSSSSTSSSSLLGQTHFQAGLALAFIFSRS